MGLFDFFKRKKRAEEIQVTHNGLTFMAPKPMSNEDYQAKRQAEVDWLEAHYDLSSAKGISSIPERADLPRPTFGDSDGFRSYTGDIDYYLRRKSAEHEEAGNIELAILCLQKSNAIRMVSRRGYRKSDYYTLVRLLARCGFIKEAKTEKEKIDTFFGNNETDCIRLNGRGQANKTIKEAYDLGTKLLIMNAHGGACPECAKYQGRVFSINGKDPRFPPLPPPFFEFGAIHKGCGHLFSPYIHGCNDPMLDYTLQFYKDIKRSYKKDIIAFSNRPFIDDRSPEDIAEANRIMEEQRIADEKKRYAEDHMIEIEAQRGAAKRDYKWLEENLSELCPKSFSGYMRMKSSNTKNYQKIVTEAAKLGYKIK